MAKKLLNTADVAEKIGVSSVTIHRRIEDGSFPKPDQVDGRRRLWEASTIVSWKAANRDLLKTMTRRGAGRTKNKKNNKRAA